jgi:predicted glycosyltransferase
VHADPRVVELSETFQHMGDIAVPIAYTGFVGRSALPRRKTGGRRIIVASTGGGRVGTDLLQTALGALRHLPQQDMELRVFMGPFMEEAHREALITHAQRDSRVALMEFSNDFIQELGRADLSISMAGYNTCMDILASRVPALVYPFPQNREQTMRAERLERLGLLRVIRDLFDEALARSMADLLADPPVSEIEEIDLNGAQATARILNELRW